MRSKSILTSGVLALMILSSSTILSSCGSNGHQSASGTTKPESLNLLTHLPGGNGPVLAVKVDDTPPAHPQINIERADVVYIEQVEGGLSRLAAIYTNPASLPDDVGPVRSARISDLDILAQYGHVGFAFSGAQRLFYPKIDAANLENLSADREPSTIYSRDKNRFEPTNLILHPKLLFTKAISVEKRVIDSVKNSGWTFGDKPLGGKAISGVSFSWPASKYSAQWSDAQKRWLLFYNGAPDFSASGIQLGSPTLVIQKVSITPSMYHDKVGGITPFSQTVGSGNAYLLRDGCAYPVVWNRPDPSQPTTWTLNNGKPADFAPGQIWIALTDSEPKFTEPAATPSTK